MLPISKHITYRSPNGDLFMVSIFKSDANINDNDYQLIEIQVKINKRFWLLNLYT